MFDGSHPLSLFPLRHHLWHHVQHGFRHHAGARNGGRIVMIVDAESVAAEIAETRVRRVEKVCENRLRRMAQRQGLELRKSRVRDPRAIDYGKYWLVDPYIDTIV